MSEDTRPEAVNHPAHYNANPSGIECIDIAEWMNFNIGNAFKYLWRADHKGRCVEDLQKARWYVAREIARSQSDYPCGPGSAGLKEFWERDRQAFQSAIEGLSEWHAVVMAAHLLAGVTLHPSHYVQDLGECLKFIDRALEQAERLAGAYARTQPAEWDAPAGEASRKPERAPGPMAGTEGADAPEDH